jgi:hypothetical protein
MGVFWNPQWVPVLGFRWRGGPLAMTTNAAEGRHHLDVPAQRVHDSGLVDRVYATSFSQAAAPAASESPRNFLKRRAPSSS